MLLHDTPAARSSRSRAAAIESLLAGLDLPEGRLTEAALARTVRALGDAAELYGDLVAAAGPHRWWMSLHEAPNLDVRVLSWSEGQDSDWHDHSGSSGAFRVLQGGLLERSRDHDGVSLVSRRIGVGSIVTFGPSHVHEVVHDASAVAVSVHAYSPPLRSLTYYDWTRYGFAAREVVPEERRAPFVVPAER